MASNPVEGRTLGWIVDTYPRKYVAPASPASIPDRSIETTMDLLTFIPIYRAASRFMPTALSSNPKTVLSRMNPTAKIAITANMKPIGISYLQEPIFISLRVSLAASLISFDCLDTGSTYLVLIKKPVI